MPLSRSYTTLLYLFLIVQIIISQRVNAQSLTVRGQIDANHLSLPNVGIVARQSGKETTTDREGKFILVVFSQDTLTLVHPNFPTRQYVLPNINRDSDISLYFDMADTSGFWINNAEHTRGPISSVALPPVKFNIPSFPWPVPPFSAKDVLDTLFFDQLTTLGQVDKRLTYALHKSGYPDPGYYQIPNGFAMVSQIEQIEADGTPKQPPARWSARVEPFSKFSLSNYLMLLFTAATGHFRVIVFLVTDIPIVTGQASVSADTAKAWYGAGTNVLPPDIRKQSFTSDYRVTALIYEFEKPENNKPQPINQSACLGQDHLSRSKITTNLTK